MQLRTAIAIIVVLGWAISLLNGMIDGDYTGMDLTTPVMLVVCGYLFGDSLMRRRYENGSND